MLEAPPNTTDRRTLDERRLDKIALVERTSISNGPCVGNANRRDGLRGARQLSENADVATLVALRGGG